jgi:hypothetical protein
MVSAGLDENCDDKTVMSHTRNGGQASDQDSNSGPGRHRQSSGQLGLKAPTETAGQAHNWVTLDHRHQHWPALSGPASRYSQLITFTSEPITLVRFPAIFAPAGAS